ncbi:hypothetical protein GT030_01315, partial [Streptomyces sp. SID1328]|nr:hypothetical protein [Streptomyces sp. SID1328]
MTAAFRDLAWRGRRASVVAVQEARQGAADGAGAHGGGCACGDCPHG